LDCGKRLLGSADLTDGDWLWPEGLAHYIDSHSVCLPDEFVETMRSRCWQVPETLQAETLAGLLGHSGPFGDLSFWRAWAGSFPKNLELRRQLEERRRERAREDFGAFLLNAIKPGRVVCRDVETTIKHWIAEINKQLFALNFPYMDDYYEAVEQARVAERRGPLQELVDTRFRLWLLLCKVEGNDRLEQLLTDVLTSMERASALAKELGIETSALTAGTLKGEEPK
jgi:predicted component of type VI protein secretion system